MKKERRLIVNAAKAVVDSGLRMIGDDGDAKSCIKDAYLERIRNFYRAELRKAVTELEDVKYLYFSLGCVHECEDVTHTIFGECAAMCEKWELQQLPIVLKYLEKTLLGFIPDFFSSEVLAIDAVEAYSKGRMAKETAMEKVSRYLSFIDWSQADWDKRFPQLALVSGTKLELDNEKISVLLNTVWKNYQDEKEREMEN